MSSVPYKVVTFEWLTVFLFAEQNIKNYSDHNNCKARELG